MLLDEPASARIREAAPRKSLKSQQTTGHQQPEDGADEIDVSLVTEYRCGIQNNFRKVHVGIYLTQQSGADGW